MKRDILYHVEIQRELHEILEFYGKISSNLADEFWKELTTAVEGAGKFPERYHFDLGGKRRCNLKRFPYHFLFREELTSIKVIVLKHDSRNPEYGRRRK